MVPLPLLVGWAWIVVVTENFNHPTGNVPLDFFFFPFRPKSKSGWSRLKSVAARITRSGEVVVKVAL